MTSLKPGDRVRYCKAHLDQSMNGMKPDLRRFFATICGVVVEPDRTTEAGFVRVLWDDHNITNEAMFEDIFSDKPRLTVV